MKNTLRILSVPLLSLLSGALLTLAFAPFNAWPMSLLALAGLFYCWSSISANKAFVSGLLFGLGFFSTSSSWVYVSIHTFGNDNIFIASAITAAFVIVLSLFIAVIGFLLNTFFKHKKSWLYIFAFAIFWMLGEWARSTLFTGFPWVLVSYAQVNGALQGLIPILGSLASSALTAFISACLVRSILQVEDVCAFKALAAAISLMLLGYALHFITWTTPENKPVTVSLVQGNIPQTLKWDPDYFSTIFSTYENLSKDYLDSQLMVWPEAAIPALQTDVEVYLKDLQQNFAKHNSTLIAGVPYLDTNTRQIYNGIIMLGANQGLYLKQHLVPFGEYLPMRKVFQPVMDWLTIPMSDFAVGANKQALLKTPDLRISSSICYEIAYASLVFADLPEANILISVSDDGWFGHSLASYQQTQIGQFRALETGRYALIATNTGITAAFNNKGRLLAALKPFEPGVLKVSVYGYEGKTPAVWLGDKTLAILLLFLLVSAKLLNYFSARKNIFKNT